MLQQEQREEEEEREQKQKREKQKKQQQEEEKEERNRSSNRNGSSSSSSSDPFSATFRTCSAHRQPVSFPPAVPGGAGGEPTALARWWSGALGAAALLWDPLVSSLAKDLPLLDAITT